MIPAAGLLEETGPWQYALTVSDKGDVFKPETVKGSQFRLPLLEFPGACAGCGQTPYAKLITQLYGDKAYWVNAIGCSMAWSAAMPSFPYTKNPEGKGPSYVCSLFENQAECGLGMAIGVRQRRQKVRLQAEELLELTAGSGLAAAIQNWLDHFDELRGCDGPSKALEEELQGAELAGEMLRHRDHFTKKVLWMYGGDGWAYDIGYGGLDHVLASGEDVNILVVDTEVYSNTGGQSSKATPFGAVAQFAAAGKRTEKKDLGMLATQYQNVYVASVALGADPAQYIRALREAEAHDGPSLIVAYAPCINHGIVKGMAWAQEEAKLAVRSGYWVLYRYDPKLKLEGKNPFILDFKDPKYDLREFFMGEVRFNSLQRTFPEAAEALLAEARTQCRNRWARYTHLAAQDYSRLLDVLEDYPIQGGPESKTE